MALALWTCARIGRPKSMSHGLLQTCFFGKLPLSVKGALCPCHRLVAIKFIERGERVGLVCNMHHHQLEYLRWLEISAELILGQLCCRSLRGQNGRSSIIKRSSIPTLST